MEAITFGSTERSLSWHIHEGGTPKQTHRSDVKPTLNNSGLAHCTMGKQMLSTSTATPKVRRLAYLYLYTCSYGGGRRTLHARSGDF